MSDVLIMCHRTRPDARSLAQRAAAWLAEHGHRGVMPTAELAFGPEYAEAIDVDTTLPEFAVALSIGGDGTMLRTVDLVSPAGIPVLGVNAGHLGYLTAVPPHEMINGLDHFFSGDYAIEERSTIDLHIESGNKTLERCAFNEIVVEKTVSGHTVNLGLEIGGTPFLNYAADGMIIATPSGSTAYNLSARGPIVSPRISAIIVTPVSPHMLFDRALVLHDDEIVRLQVIEDREAALVVDGVHVSTLSPGDAIVCKVGKVPARLVTFENRDVHSILKSKFGLADR